MHILTFLYFAIPAYPSLKKNLDMKILESQFCLYFTKCDMRTKIALKKQFLSSNFILLPVAMEVPPHWYLLIFLNFQTWIKRKESIKEIYILDSLSNTRLSESHFQDVVVPFLKSIFELDEKVSFETTTLKVPKQRNGYDCGVYVIALLDIIASTEFNDNMSIVDNIGYEIERHNLNVSEYRKKIHGLAVNLLQIQQSQNSICHRGIENEGHSCYIISVFQFLFTKIDMFVNIYDSIVKDTSVLAPDQQNGWIALLNIFSQVICVAHSRLQVNKPNMIPLSKRHITKWRKLMKTLFPNRELFDSDVDNDCSELLYFLINLGEKYFSSFLHSYNGVIECSGCLTQRTRTLCQEQSVFNINLPMYDGTKTIPELIQQELEECIDCECPNCKNQNIKHICKLVTCERVADTFIIHISREGVTDPHSGQRIAGLNVSCVDIFNADGRVTIYGHDYKLIAAVYHVGEDTSKGHHVVDSKRPTLISNNKRTQNHIWHKFDDRTYKRYDNNYLSAMDCNEKKNKMIGCHLLMYERIV